jgi:hypothetical protein
MSKLNLTSFLSAFKDAGKKLAQSNVELVATHETINVLDDEFGGRYTGDFGDYIRIRTAEGIAFVSVLKGTPATANAYQLQEYVALEDYEHMHKGDRIFKAAGIVVE